MIVNLVEKKIGDNLANLLNEDVKNETNSKKND